jgi:hypothetical protein
MKVMKHIENERGIALVIAMVMLLTLTILGITALTTSRMGVLISGNEKFQTEALQAADAGIERGFLDLTRDYRADTNWGNNTLNTISSGASGTITNAASYTFDDAFRADMTAGLLREDVWGNPFAASPTFGSAWDLYGSQALGGATYRSVLLKSSTQPDEVYLRSYAQLSSGAKKIIQLHLRVDAIDAWKNAIFAGGSGTQIITGNYRVGGPVHILGTGISPGEEVWAMSGAAELINGYNFNGMTQAYAQSIKAKLPSIEHVTVGGESVETLETILRVKRGVVDLSGSANIGADGTDHKLTDIAGDEYKSYIDAIRTNEALTGYEGKTFSDEINMDKGYDLGDKIQMPNFTGDQYTDPNGAVWDDYETYLNANSFTVPKGVAPDAQSTDQCNLVPYKNATDKGTPAFCLMDGGACPGGACPENPAKGCIKWNPGAGAGGTLVTTGRVKFDATCPAVTIGRSGSYDVTYQGKGVLHSDASITVAGNLISSGIKLNGDAGAIFTTDHLLGIMTKANLLIGASATVMGAFFSSSTMSAENNSNIIGTMASNQFGLGSGMGAASIFYVKQLSPNVKGMGMITSRTVYTFKNYEWTQVY